MAEGVIKGPLRHRLLLQKGKASTAEAAATKLTLESSSSAKGLPKAIERAAYIDQVFYPLGVVKQIVCYSLKLRLTFPNLSL